MLKTPAASPPPAVMSNHRAMSSKCLPFAAACIAMLIPACGEKSEEAKAEDERRLIRAERRKQAVELYQKLAKEYPDDPKAGEAKQKATALQAAGGK